MGAASGSSASEMVISNRPVEGPISQQSQNNFQRLRIHSIPAGFPAHVKREIHGESFNRRNQRFWVHAVASIHPSQLVLSPYGTPQPSSHSSPVLSAETQPQSLNQWVPFGTPEQSSHSSPVLSAETQPQSLNQWVPFGTPAQSEHDELSPLGTPHSSRQVESSPPQMQASLNRQLLS